MSDDIVTRLRQCAELERPLFWRSQIVEAADEIERLRAIIRDIANAATDEGIKPGYHKQQVNYVRTMWNPLWRAISRAVVEVRGE